MLNRFIYIVIVVVLAGLLGISCNTTRYVPQGEYLLKENEIELTQKAPGVSKSEMKLYLRQRENKSSLFGWKFHLRLYSASPRCDSGKVDTTKRNADGTPEVKCGWLGRTMRKLGEEPVIYNPAAVYSSVRNLEDYLQSIGYYYASVKDTVLLKKKKAIVKYIVTPGKPYIIDKIDYLINDSILKPVILQDTVNSLLKRGQQLSVKALEDERTRIEDFLNNNGYYTFNRNLINYTADTLAGDYHANLTVKLDKEQKENVDSLNYNKRFKIRNVKIYAEYDAVEAYTNKDYMDTYSRNLAKQVPGAGDIEILYRKEQNIRTGTLLTANTIEPGDYYSDDIITKTYNNLTSLRLFRVVNIRMNKVATNENDTLLDCMIHLSPRPTQSFDVKMDVSVSSLGLLGLSPAISYYHRNIFHGAEWLTMTFSDNYQFDPFNITSGKRSNELTASVSISLPKFLFPYLNKYFRSYSPRTDFTMSYNYQLRPEYTRNSLAFTLGYNWRTKPQFSYTVNILNLNIVKLFNLSPEFWQSIQNDPYLRNRYEDHFVLGANASFVYSTRQPNNKSNSILLRWSVGTAGNVLSAFNGLLHKNDNGNYLIWGTPYSQYAKTDVNFSQYIVFNEKQTLAYRLFAGIGRGYGNSISLPYEEVYYSGGAYSLRGWQSRTVGPGAAPIDSTFTIPNQVGDFKLEANLEYRFKIIDILYGALFLDAGNVWSLNYEEADPLAVLDWDTFYKQIALNTGFGIRFNFIDFLVIRFDLGVQLYDPRMYIGWVEPRNLFALSNLSLHFGIGFPF